MDWNLLLTFFWLSISAGVLVPGVWLLIDGKTNLTIINVILQRFYLFGKLKNENKDKKKVFGDVPKSYFLHFYILGLLIYIPFFSVIRFFISYFALSCVSTFI
jgi:hypothetical protein